MSDVSMGRTRAGEAGDGAGARTRALLPNAQVARYVRWPECFPRALGLVANDNGSVWGEGNAERLARLRRELGR